MYRAHSLHWFSCCCCYFAAVSVRLGDAAFDTAYHCVWVMCNHIKPQVTLLAYRPSIDSKGHPRTRSRSEEHTSELQSLMRISYAVFCLKKKKNTTIATR